MSLKGKGFLGEETREDAIAPRSVGSLVLPVPNLTPTLRGPEAVSGPSGVSDDHNTPCSVHSVSLHAPAQQDASSLS